jgi:hypothetical protein
LNHGELFTVGLHVEKLIESFFEARRFQYLSSPVQAGHGDLRSADSFRVPFQALLEFGGEEITNYPKATFPGGFYVRLAAGGGWIGIIDDEIPFLLDASLQETAFASPGSGEVHADSQVCLRQVTLIERALPGALDANENHCLHSADQEVQN